MIVDQYEKLATPGVTGSWVRSPIPGVTWLCQSLLGSWALWLGKPLLGLQALWLGLPLRGSHGYVNHS